MTIQALRLCCTRTLSALLLLVLSYSALAAQPQMSRTFYVRDFGALGDGSTKDTAALARAIDAAAQHGGIVVFTPGIYVSGTLELKSHVTLQLEAGAELRGSTDPNDYGTIAAFGFDRRYGVNSSGEGDRVGLLVARDAEDITIEGEGTIDGSGDSFFDANQPHIGGDFDPLLTRNPDAFMSDMHRTDDGPLEVLTTGRPGTMLIFSRCQHITIDGVSFRNAPNWTFHLQHTRDIYVTHLRVVNDTRLPNNDGMDCMDCRNVHVSDSDFTTGDDDFAFVGSEDVTVANCVLRSYSAAIRLEDTRNSVFSNLVIHANRGIAVFERTDAETHDVLFTNVVIKTHLVHGHWWGKGEPIYLASSATAGHGSVHDVVFTNVLADAEAGILLDSRSPGTVTAITLRNVSLTMHAPEPAIADALGGNFDLRWTATSFSNAVFRHDTPALYGHNIGTLTVDGLDLHWPAAMPAYFSSAIQVEDFDHLDLSHIRVSHAPGSEAPAIDLARGNTFSLRDSTATLGTGTFLRLAQVTGPLFFSGNDLQAAKVTGVPPAKPVRKATAGTSKATAPR
jgi:Glycosyl hydrolases family 28/Pectate lyase superfamily protein